MNKDDFYIWVVYWGKVLSLNSSADRSLSRAAGRPSCFPRDKLTTLVSFEQLRCAGKSVRSASACDASAKIRIFRCGELLSIDRPGLIGVRPHRSHLLTLAAMNSTDESPVQVFHTCPVLVSILKMRPSGEVAN